MQIACHISGDRRRLSSPAVLVPIAHLLCHEATAVGLPAALGVTLHEAFNMDAILTGIRDGMVSP